MTILAIIAKVKAIADQYVSVSKAIAVVIPTPSATPQLESTQVLYMVWRLLEKRLIAQRVSRRLFLIRVLLHLRGFGQRVQTIFKPSTVVKCTPNQDTDNGKGNNKNP